MIRTSAVLALAVLAACGADEPEQVPLPDGVVMHVDQTRVERSTRNIFVRVENDTGQTIKIARFTLRSPRFDPVAESSGETIPARSEADLELVLPQTRCGDDLDASVTLTYRLGDSDQRESTGPADDPFQQISLLMDRDCARTTLAEAVDLEVGQPKVEGSGATSVLHLPVTLTPTGERDDVRFGGFESTPLFRQGPGSPVDVDEPISSTETTYLDMTVVPARCDPHALAEDKVGRLFGMRIMAPGLPDDTSFYLPLGEHQRTAFYAYFRARCGL